MIFAPIALLIAYLVVAFGPDSFEVESEMYPNYEALESSGLLRKAGFLRSFLNLRLIFVSIISLMH
jgi:hypothetical protein